VAGELQCDVLSWKQDLTVAHRIQFLSYACTVFDHSLLVESLRFRVHDSSAVVETATFAWNGTCGAAAAKYETGELTALEAAWPWTAGSGNLTCPHITLIPRHRPADTCAGRMTFYDQAMAVLAAADLRVQFTESAQQRGTQLE